MNSQGGQTIGKFRVIKLLGEGAMGEVYQALDPDLQREVAIKVLHPHFARQPNFHQRFIQEARVAARMDHPGIVKVHESGQINNQLYIVMELIPGVDMRSLLERQKKEKKQMPLGEALRLVRQVAQALDYAHRAGVLHRDLKPENIMLKQVEGENVPYRPVLTDLGLAKLVEGGYQTTTGMVMGTPAYMSPEQALGETTDVRSDVYSLGVLLYELAVGRLPSQAKTITEAVRYHLKETLPLPRSFRPDLPEEVEAVILKALAKEPEKRYQSAAELAKALEVVEISNADGGLWQGKDRD